MRSHPHLPRSWIEPVFLALLAGLMPVAATAQTSGATVPDAPSVATAPADTAAAPEALAEVPTGRLRHPMLLAASASYVHLLPIHILKQEVYDINDLTKAGTGVMGDVRLYVLDGLALSAGAIRSGFGLRNDQPDRMYNINRKFSNDERALGDTITVSNYIKLDGVFVNLTAYLGNQLTPGSRFDPYLRASLMYYDWALLKNGRGSNPVTWQDEPIEGKDLGYGLGIGTEYNLDRKLSLDLQMLWGYVRSGDQIKWEGFQDNLTKSYFWTNTHFWNLSLGMVVGI